MMAGRTAYYQMFEDEGIGDAVSIDGVGGSLSCGVTQTTVS